MLDELRRSAKRGRADDALSRLSRAVELLERGDPRGAASEGEKAKALAPRAPSVREVLGLALYGQERFAEALREMQAYRRMSGRADQNHIVMDCLRAVGRTERIVPLAEEALRARITNEAKAEAIVVAAAALTDAGRFDEALAFLRRARTRDDVGEDWVLRLWYVTADVLERAGRVEEAVREFRKILRHDAGAFDVAERLAQLG
ncbi:MAG TPA: tetratricopeptide repeat protein [Actinomycetota bacterium]|nr:tetratricopeptide repeat protein [Actinomycetota bacterium]